MSETSVHLDQLAHLYHVLLISTSQILDRNNLINKYTNNLDPDQYLWKKGLTVLYVWLYSLLLSFLLFVCFFWNISCSPPFSGQSLLSETKMFWNCRTIYLIWRLILSLYIVSHILSRYFKVLTSILVINWFISYLFSVFCVQMHIPVTCSSDEMGSCAEPPVKTMLFYYKKLHWSSFFIFC